MQNVADVYFVARFKDGAFEQLDSGPYFDYDSAYNARSDHRYSSDTYKIIRSPIAFEVVKG